MAFLNCSSNKFWSASVICGSGGSCEVATGVCNCSEAFRHNFLFQRYTSCDFPSSNNAAVYYWALTCCILCGLGFATAMFWILKILSGCHNLKPKKNKAATVFIPAALPA